MESIRSRIDNIALLQFDLHQSYVRGEVTLCDFTLINKYLERCKVELKEIVKNIK